MLTIPGCVEMIDERKHRLCEQAQVKTYTESVTAMWLYNSCGGYRSASNTCPNGELAQKIQFIAASCQIGNRYGKYDLTFINHFNNGNIKVNYFAHITKEVIKRADPSAFVPAPDCIFKLNMSVKF